MLDALQNKSNLRILLIRADRMGDVVVTTPVFPVIKQKFPNCRIAVLVKKENKDLIEGNPFIDEVIAYDHLVDGTFKNHWLFSQMIRQKKFDVSIQFHPRDRFNWLTWLAAIPVRIGYRVKNHWLLTHTIRDTKGAGEKHEAEYNFDLLKFIDIAKPKKLEPHIPLELSAKPRALELLSNIGRYFVIHPHASCPSKRWPLRYFAAVADKLSIQYKATAVLVGAGNASDDARERDIMNLMKTKAHDLTGRVTLKELAWVLKGSYLVLSNDSGPAHVAAALDVPVVTIFGRSLAGLGPARWLPLGRKSWYAYKDVGCKVCLAHLCDIGFKCLEDLHPDEVLRLIESKKEEF